MEVQDEICVTLFCRTKNVAVLQCMTEGSKRKNGSCKDKLHKLTLEREADTPTSMLLGLGVEESAKLHIPPPIGDDMA